LLAKKETPIVQDFLNMSSWTVNTSLEANWTLGGNAFLRGVDAKDLVGANASICFQNVTQFYFHEFNDYLIKMHYGSFQDKLFNSTAIVANASLDLITCTYAT
jgi:hypothetical protein